MEKKKISIPSREELAMDALRRGDNGAEWEALRVMTANVLAGIPLETRFQAVTNAIVAKAFVMGKLPPMKRGRPQSEDGVDGWSVALLYFKLKDAGMSYADAVAEVAGKFHKDERQIMRLVNRYKSEVGGDDPAQRQRKSEWLAVCAKMAQLAEAEGRKGYFEIALEALHAIQDPDPKEALDSLLDHTLRRPN